MRKIKLFLAFVIVCFLAVGISASFSSDEPPVPVEEPPIMEEGELIPTSEFGEGPVEITEVLLENNGDPTMSGIRVFFDEGQMEMVAGDPAFQLRLFMCTMVDVPEQVLYFSAGNAMMVTPDFEMITPGVPFTLDPGQNSILFHFPVAWPEPILLATLGWDTDPQMSLTTPIPGLNYFGHEISRYTYDPMNLYNANEVLMLQDTASIQRAQNKVWPLPDDQAIEDDSDPPGGSPGGLYPGFPKRKPKTGGPPVFWYYEYSGPGGLIKRCHIDVNGNGKKDKGEPDGYIGRCPHDPGSNVQQLYTNGCYWFAFDGIDPRTSLKRIVHKFFKKKFPDGTEKWVVESTHQSRDKATDPWKDTPVKDPHKNPIVHEGPYQNPGSVPGPSDFGQ